MFQSSCWQVEIATVLAISFEPARDARPPPSTKESSKSHRTRPASSGMEKTPSPPSHPSAYGNSGAHAADVACAESTASRIKAQFNARIGLCSPVVQAFNDSLMSLLNEPLRAA